MAVSTVILSDGEPLEVRQLDLFALDEVEATLIGPYTYEVTADSGKVYLAEYDGSRWENEPQKPQKPLKLEHEIEQGSDDWYDLVEWHRYNAWLVHERKRNALMNEYNNKVARYILDNCISEEGRGRLVKPEDWGLVHKAALVPELTLEVLAETLQATFQGIVWR